jgi:hypothetical protein
MQHFFFSDSPVYFSLREANDKRQTIDRPQLDFVEFPETDLNETNRTNQSELDSILFSRLHVYALPSLAPGEGLCMITCYYY